MGWWLVRSVVRNQIATYVSSQQENVSGVEIGQKDGWILLVRGLGFER
jgi:hypothetical protein